ncbi:MAG: hypothetical protein NT003_00545 [Candidatus Magasanikbacteria bacterium]|nr:hypothetical protein [Candidatus Magasanikbacteria bacterium]
MSQPFETQFAFLNEQKQIVIAAIATGAVFGSALYEISKRMNSAEHLFVAGAGLSALSIIFFVAWAARETRLRWQLVVAMLGIIGFSALLMFRSRGFDFTSFIQPALVVIYLFVIGWAVSYMGDGGGRATSASLFIYAQKVLEICVVSVVSVITSILLGRLGGSLFEIVGVTIPNSVVDYLLYPIFATIPLVALVLTYDFSKPLIAQTPILGIVKFFSTIGYGLTFVLAPFLFIYLLVLLPFGFSTLLATGKTAGTFLMLCVGCSIFLYATLLWKSARHTIIHHYTTKILLLLLSAEAAILSAVALYAVAIRIQSLGITLDRFVVAGASAIVCAVCIGFVHTFFISGTRDWTLENLKSRIEKIAFSGLVGLLALMAIISIFNIENYSVRSHIDRVIENKNGNSFFDQEFIFRNGDAGITYSEIFECFDFTAVANWSQLSKLSSRCEQR